MRGSGLGAPRGLRGLRGLRRGTAKGFLWGGAVCRAERQPVVHAESHDAEDVRAEDRSPNEGLRCRLATDSVPETEK